MGNVKDMSNVANMQISLTISVSGLSYTAAVKKFLPYILPEIAKLKHAAPFIEVLNASPEIVCISVDALPQNLKDTLAERAINEFEDKIIDFLQTYALKKNIKVTVGKLRAFLNGSAIEIRVLIDDVDYVSVADLLIPYYLSTGKQMEETAAGQKLLNYSKFFYYKDWEDNSRILEKAGDVAKAVTKSALLLLPKRKLEAIAVSAINANRQKIAESIEQYSRDNGIALSLNVVTAEIVDAGCH